MICIHLDLIPLGLNVGSCWPAGPNSVAAGPKSAGQSDPKVLSLALGMADYALMVLLQSLQTPKGNSLAFTDPNLLPRYSNNSSSAYTLKLVAMFAPQQQQLA